LIETVFIRGVEDLQYTKKFRLEPELLVVLLAAMVSTGTIEVTVESNTYNALNLSDFILLPVSKLSQFSHVKKPSGLPIEELNAISGLFGVSIPNYEEEMLSKVIVTVTEKANDAINKSLSTIQVVKKGYPTWDGLIKPCRNTRKCINFRSIQRILKA
jgi:hypothetical protein